CCAVLNILITSEINEGVTRRHLPRPHASSRHASSLGIPAVTQILPTETALERAVALLRAGDIIAIPTETVYGLAAVATNGEAVARIYEVKGRPRFNPLIVHVSDRAMAEEIAVFDAMARRLADAFWPGALTLVLPLRRSGAVHPLTTAGLETVALRMPQGFAAEVIAR